MSLRSGATVLHYRIERLLGAGGMGEVYLAQDTTLNRQVAIKFLATPDDDRARRRLQREARAAAGLDHPGICAVYQVGTDPTLGDFVVMQYVEGETLSDRLHRGRLDPTEALHVAEHIADALGAAHERGIVHRDLKPQNIIIMPSGRPKLLDFGLAKRALSGPAAAAASTTAALTRPDAVLGTPGYMAPEQIRNGTVDRRADVFALGCVLYECLTGHRAFPGPTAPDMMSRVLQSEPPPVSSVVPGLNVQLDSLCARLLYKDVSGRCQSADEALGAIRAQLPPGSAASDAAWRPSHVSGTSWSRVNWRWTAIAVVAVLLLVGTGVWVTVWRHRHQLPAPVPAAKIWFDRGVTAIREGAYAGARDSFEEAIRLDPRYAQAYARLADARLELDDERGAGNALLHVHDLVPDTSTLPTDDRLQLEAVSASVLGNHDRAIAAYQAIAGAHPADAPAALDLGRAEEAAYHLASASASYKQALHLDNQYAAAYARLGFLQDTPRQTALQQLDEAVRLYATAADVEGEAEALVRKGVVLSALGRYEDARHALDQVLSLTADPRYASLRVRAELETARVMAYSGRFQESEGLGRKAVDEARAAGWQVVAANGLVDLGTTLQFAHQTDAADGLFEQALTLATAQGATRTAMRAQTAQASLRQFTHRPQDAIDLGQAPLKFFADGHYPRLEATTKAIVSRAEGDLEHYSEAMALATDGLKFAEGAGNDELVATALETLAEQLEALGRLPEALADRERLDQIHRTEKDMARLAYDLTNHAEELIELGRTNDATALLDEVEAKITAGIEPFKARAPRLAVERALAASVARQFGTVLKRIPVNSGPSGAASDETALYARVLAEHAKAALGQPGSSSDTVAHWLDDTNEAAFRREMAYWVADTLAARGDGARAVAIAQAALTEPGGRDNLELRWRLEALVAAAQGPTGGASMRDHARADLQRLGDQWGDAAKAYLDRPDLKELRRAVQ